MSLTQKLVDPGEILPRKQGKGIGGAVRGGDALCVDVGKFKRKVRAVQEFGTQSLQSLARVPGSYADGAGGRSPSLKDNLADLELLGYAHDRAGQRGSEVHPQTDAYRQMLDPRKAFDDCFRVQNLVGGPFPRPQLFVHGYGVKQVRSARHGALVESQAMGVYTCSIGKMKHGRCCVELHSSACIPGDVTRWVPLPTNNVM